MVLEEMVELVELAEQSTVEDLLDIVLVSFSQYRTQTPLLLLRVVVEQMALQDKALLRILVQQEALEA
jgi:hypothetical protein